VPDDERTLDDDPAQAIQKLVDVANKALSAAVNDPTTAVQCVDPIEDFLCYTASKHLSVGLVTDCPIVRASAGHVGRPSMGTEGRVMRFHLGELTSKVMPSRLLLRHCDQVSLIPIIGRSNWTPSQKEHAA
jgi:hypothetical protein